MLMKVLMKTTLISEQQPANWAHSKVWHTARLLSQKAIPPQRDTTTAKRHRRTTARDVKQQNRHIMMQNHHRELKNRHIMIQNIHTKYKSCIFFIIWCGLPCSYRRCVTSLHISMKMRVTSSVVVINSHPSTTSASQRVSRSICLPPYLEKKRMTAALHVTITFKDVMMDLRLL